jgi:formate-dependent nitrite reductase membrane component NrfD
MQVYQWMVNYTRQTEWIDRRGILLWIAFYAGGLGGGLYLVSLLLNSLWGMFISWIIIAVIKGSTHMMFLGKPLRFWRIVFRPGSSWISRGIIFVLSFALLAAVQMVLTYLMPGSVLEIVFKVLAGLAALAVAGYTGFVLNNIKAVPFWNSKLLPILFISYGFMGGFGLAVLIGLLGGDVNLAMAETGTRWLLFINIVLLGIYLWTAAKRETTGKQSVLEQMHGGMAPIFWAGIVVCGIVIPLTVALINLLAGELAMPILMAGALCELIGGLSLRYCILKAGAYKPLVAKPSPASR